MSASLVHTEHINVLLWAARQYATFGPLTWYYDNPTRQGRLTLDNFDEVGQMLVDANAESVDASRRRSFRVAPASPPREYRYTKPGYTNWSLTELLNALDGYVYQTDEARKWEKSQAHAFCNALRTALVCALPGYHSGPWTITPDSAPLRPRSA